MSTELPPFIDRYLAWWIAGAIVVLGLFVYGLRDVLRFSWKRVWAISSVNFAESIRRRVLWITPLAILGVILISQLSNPVDAQDAIRQTTKFALFASGLVVTITAIILACTNLPREIESRVIFTVVTKPITRLEIILGKVIGFARVSAAILIIMGVFTLGYLHIRAWNLHNHIVKLLDSGQADAISKPTLEYYKQAGLLSAKEYERPDDLQVFSRPPVPGDERRWMAGGGEGSFLVPFSIPAEQLVSPNDPNEPAHLGFVLSVGYARTGEKTELEEAADVSATTLPYLIQHPDATPEQVRIQSRAERAASAARMSRRPSVAVQILDHNFNTLVDPKLVNSGNPIELSDPSGTAPIPIPISPDGVKSLSRGSELFWISVTGGGGGYEYFAGPEPVMFVDAQSNGIAPMRDPRPDGAGKPVRPSFRTRDGTYGLQLRGATRGVVPVAVYAFRNAKIQPSGDGNVPFEMRVGIERTDSDGDPSIEQPTTLELTFVDLAKSANATPPDRTASATPPATQPAGVPTGATIRISPETNQPSFFAIPASAIPSENFDVHVRALTPGHYVGVHANSLALVVSEQSFAFNLFKGLTVLWLLSLLVIIVSIFASTFVSWPIAIMLTVLILLGRWGVDQLGDAIAPGVGNTFVSDFFRTKDVDVATTVSRSVEALTKLLRMVSSVLPDISRFSAIEDLERGVAVSMSRLTDAGTVILLFGVPMIVLSYVFLRKKEVAP